MGFQVFMRVMSHGWLYGGVAVVVKTCHHCFTIPEIGIRRMSRAKRSRSLMRFKRTNHEQLAELAAITK